MISDKKKKEVSELKELMIRYRVISLGDITSLPSKQFQNIRKKLKDKVLIKVTKKRLIKKAIDSIKEKDLKPLEKYLEDSMPVLLFTNEDPFKLYKLLKKSKSKAVARPGQTAPNDLFIEAGPTNFTPGPIIGELGQIGIVAAVEQGKVTIKRDKLLVKEGEIINEKVASILSKLGIEPMEIGLNLKVSYDNGTLYDKSVLDFDEDKLLNNIKLAHQYVLSLALKIKYFTKETVKLLISKAASQARALNSKLNLKEEVKKIEVKKTEEEKEKKIIEENLKKSDFEKNGEKAREVIQKMKDEGEIKKHTGEKEKAKPSPIKAEDLIKEE
ncbi:MAG: 50S ribosomal protein L10 [Candidatus Heimdallarchaeaceae archaeon]